MNDFAGVWGTADPAASLRAMGVEPSWCDARAAFGGGVFWRDPHTDLIFAGEYVASHPAPVNALPVAAFAEAYRREGIAAGRLLPAQFSLAVYEPATGRLTLLRDPCGGRTLYHATGADGSRWFAARARTLAKSPVVGPDLSLPALRDYLTCAFVPRARTLRRDVFELRPGFSLVLPAGRHENYWTPEESLTDAADAPLETYAARLRPILDDAVRRNLPPEDPVGASLSGGVDSSLVVALAAKERGGANLRTYSLHFGPGYANELAFSDLVAAHCGTKHTVLEFPIALIQKHLEETHALLDDPIGDPLTVPNFLMARHAAREVGVLLNGEGGDPIFGGPKNGPMLLNELYEEPTDAARIDAYFRSYQKCYDDLPRLLTPEVIAALQKEPPQETLLTPFLGDEAVMRHYLNRLMQINVALKGADQILTKINNLTSAVGLLGRSPLFDVRVAEAGFAIPPVYKREAAEEKTVLKRAVADVLPPAILTRPKSGMLVPVQKWFREDLNRYARGMLLSRQARIRPYLRQDVIQEWLEYRPTPYPRQGVKLWLVLALELWLRAHE
jgi:asparagine synthase (glutamine-hydrolysing)